MPLQQSLNNQAISQLPKISELIKSANQSDADQMTSRALREINNCTPCLDDMSEEQKNGMQDDLISSFKYNGWID